VGLLDYSCITFTTGSVRQIQVDTLFAKKPKDNMPARIVVKVKRMDGGLLDASKHKSIPVKITKNVIPVMMLPSRIKIVFKKDSEGVKALVSLPLYSRHTAGGPEASGARFRVSGAQETKRHAQSKKITNARIPSIQLPSQPIDEWNPVPIPSANFDWLSDPEALPLWLDMKSRYANSTRWRTRTVCLVGAAHAACLDLSAQVVYCLFSF
jgi:hypothetical protein